MRFKTAFNQGYLAACLRFGADHPELASEALADAGITEAAIMDMDLTDDDKATLTAIRRANLHDPIKT